MSPPLSKPHPIQAAFPEQPDRPKTPQERVFQAVRAAQDDLDNKGSPVLERRTEIHLSSSRTSLSNSVQDLSPAPQLAVETPPVQMEVEVESTYVNVIPATSTPKVSEIVPTEQRASPIPPISDLGSSGTGNLNETPTQRKRTLPARPTIAPKPSVSSRATSEPPSGLPPHMVPQDPHMVLSGGEPTSLPHEAQQNQDSPMPELLSLKDRLKLFEKEIDDQQKVPEPKKDRKFSFLSDDEVVKMKEEEAKRIASMTALDLEAFDSLTSHLSIEDDAQTVRTQHEELERYDCSEITATKVDEEEETKVSEAEQKAAWRKARLDSLEEDTMQAQIVIEKMSELSTFDTGREEEEDNANFRHPVDMEGNITGHMEGNITGPRRAEDEEVEVNSDSELTSSEETTTPGPTSPEEIQGGGQL